MFPRFGDVAIDSQLASSASISGVQELLNGCICCNLVGQLSDALEALHKDVAPNRIIIETSGSAFPATLAMEVNRLATETGKYVLDGVVVVIDVENWQGYEDTSYTAKMQARYTDLIIFNKWEKAGERRYDDCLDRVGDLDIPVAMIKSDKGSVGHHVLLGIDNKVSKELTDLMSEHSAEEAGHDHAHDHSEEVEVLSITLPSSGSPGQSVNLDSLETFLLAAPKQEIYRIKGILKASRAPASSGGEIEAAAVDHGGIAATYVLNWAFGRWKYTPLSRTAEKSDSDASTSTQGPVSIPSETSANEPLLRMTVILARGEANSWKKRIESQSYIEIENEESEAKAEVKRLS